MRSLLRALALSGLAIALLTGGFIFWGDVQAQEATPPPLAFTLGPGVTAQDVAPTQHASGLIRVQIAAGATWTFTDDDPTITLIYGEAASTIFTIQGPVTVFRADAAGKPGEAIEAGVEFTFGEGDYLAGPPLTAGSIRNDGTAPATILIASIFPPEL